MKSNIEPISGKTYEDLVREICKQKQAEGMLSMHISVNPCRNHDITPTEDD